VLTTRVRFDPPRYVDDATRLRAIESMIDRLTAVPGVSAVTATQALPIVEGEPRRRFTIAGRAAPPVSGLPWAAEAATLGDYQQTFRLPLLEGRGWSPADRAAGWSVAIVNREAARVYWPSASPIGDRILMVDASGKPSGAAVEIIGVVDNVLGDDLPEDPDLAASDLQPARRQIDNTLRTFNLVMALFVGFGGIGLIVALRSACASRSAQPGATSCS
jgi:putative ABC transport system permease protein